MAVFFPFVKHVLGCRITGLPAGVERRGTVGVRLPTPAAVLTSVVSGHACQEELERKAPPSDLPGGSKGPRGRRLPTFPSLADCPPLAGLAPSGAALRTPSQAPLTRKVRAHGGGIPSSPGRPQPAGPRSAARVLAVGPRGAPVSPSAVPQAPLCPCTD